ncbi:MAG: VIT domain-containing protein [Gemmatimonadetes bacterium]|nr:VIT domain-containing protein [Gemmatimonadota bacterium]
MRTLFALVTLTTMAAPLAAQGWIEPPVAVLGNGVSKIRTAVHVTVSGRIAQVEVEEWFRNDGTILGEGDYLYPLPGEAVFSNFSLFQGDQELRGETMDAARARSIYEEIVRRKRDPALIELVGHGMVRARIFPINPGETRKITLRYTQVMERAGGALHFQYAAGSRHDGTPRPIRDGAVIRPSRPADIPLSFVLEIADGDAFRDPFSPTHGVEVERRDGRIRVRPEGNLRGNFALFLPLARGLVGVTMATHKPSEDPGYFMLTLSPGDADGESAPRDMTVVVDVSGSMSGEKLDQAKAALRQVLGSLGERDRFRLIAFSNMVSTHSRDWIEVSERTLRAARRWVDGLNADGGTNIAGALREAFRLESDESRLPIVLFLTDGLPSVGEENPERIAQQAEQLRNRARVFAFGVGYDVNTYLLDRLTAAGRGATEYVEPTEDVERAIGTLATKIQHPVLTDLEIDDVPVRLSEIYPLELPDLFAGEELIVFGRYAALDHDRAGALRLTARRAGRTERFTTDVTFPAHQLGSDFIPRLWASRKLGHLARQIRIEGHSADLEREIRETALRYGLLSEYTSYLVQEPEVVAADALRAGSIAMFQSANARRASGRSSGAAVPASPPVGRKAVQAAERQRVQREVASAADLDRLEESFADEATGLRLVAGRWFRPDRDMWIDTAHRGSASVVEVEIYSKTYFDLLQALPELERWLTELESVLIAGAETSIKFVAERAPSIEGNALARLVQEFRGH